MSWGGNRPEGTPFSVFNTKAYLKYLRQKKFEKTTLISVMVETGIRRVENKNTGHVSYKAKFSEMSKSFPTLLEAQEARSLMKSGELIVQVKKHKDYKIKRT